MEARPAGVAGKMNGWLVVLLLAAVTAAACGDGSGECSPPCSAGFDCYYGTCVPHGPDFGSDGVSDGDDDGDSPRRDDGASDDGSDASAEGGGCTGPRDCDDGNSCTEDLCDPATRTCSNTIASDGALCPDGLCCAGECRIGADCCSDAYCLGGCMGVARACTEVPGESCSTQVGCSGTGVTSCEGPAEWCYDLDVNQDTCEGCGCVYSWSSIPPTCTGIRRAACAAVSDPDLCSDCGCTWHAGCDGVHEACDAYADRATCESQLDCTWSTCTDYRCT
jgi:hypothetical protein